MISHDMEKWFLLFAHHVGTDSGVSQFLCADCGAVIGEHGWKPTIFFVGPSPESADKMAALFRCGPCAIADPRSRQILPNGVEVIEG